MLSWRPQVVRDVLTIPYRVPGNEDIVVLDLSSDRSIIKLANVSSGQLIVVRFLPASDAPNYIL